MRGALSRSVRDNIARFGLADAAFWLYGRAARADPRSIFTNVRYRRSGAPDRLPIPPADLIFLVAGSSDVGWFLTAGARAAASIADVLRSNGVAIQELGAMLDFGCGCGRVLRHWSGLTKTRICATDYNPALVEWCRQNLPFVEARVNRLFPPLGYPDAHFDLVYALSVFTHLTPELQTAWMAELTRVVRPGGHLIITTHGDSYVSRLNQRERRRFASGELVVKNDTGAPGSNACAAYHPYAYVRHRLAGGLEMLDFVFEGARGNPRQDLYLLRKPAGGM
jgi:Methyltransferase domain